MHILAAPASLKHNLGELTAEIKLLDLRPRQHVKKRASGLEAVQSSICVSHAKIDQHTDSAAKKMKRVASHYVHEILSRVIRV